MKRKTPLFININIQEIVNNVYQDILIDSFYFSFIHEIVTFLQRIQTSPILLHFYSLWILFSVIK